MSFCAPGVKSNKTTCYSKDDLLFLIKSYNRNNRNKISTKGKSKKELWNILHNRLRSDCNNEWCWLEQNFVPPSYSREKIKETFKPKMPESWKKNPYEWLSNIDIDKVMKQYQKKYPSFIYPGTFPVDCPTAIRCPLTGINVKKLISEGKTKMGVIFNLDRHDQPGSHWVATYFDFKRCKIFYFDPVGVPPPQMIREFLESVKAQCEKRTKIYVNNTQFQFGSMYFIISNLRGNKLRKDLVTDNKMNEMREKYYRKNEN
jgi:hypothetical protein